MLRRHERNEKIHSRLPCSWATLNISTMDHRALGKTGSTEPAAVSEPGKEKRWVFF